MQSTKSNSKLPPANNKKKRLNRISATLENLHTLKIEHSPDYSHFLLIFLIIFGFSLILFRSQNVPNVYISVFFLVPIIQYFFSNRAIVCYIDKQSEEVKYYQKGIFGSSIAKQNISCNLSEISHLKMEKIKQPRAYSFRMVLFLKNGKRLQLSSNNLSSADCRRVATKLCSFLERDIQLEGYK